MSLSSNQTDISLQDDYDVPVAMFVCLGVGGYLILVIVIIFVYKSLKGHNSCSWDCGNCGSCCKFGSNKTTCSCKDYFCCVNCGLCSCFSGLCGHGSKKWCSDTSSPCSGCSKSGNSCWPSFSCGCCPSITKCFPSCNCECDKGCMCLCLEIKVHKRGNQRGPYNDSYKTKTSETDGDNTGQSCITHSSPQHSHVNGELGKQQRFHQHRGFDSSVISDVTSVEGIGIEKKSSLNSRSIQINSTREQFEQFNKAEVFMKSDNYKKSQRKLPPPPYEEEDSSTSAFTKKSRSHGGTAYLSNSEGNNRLGSRIRRSLHAGRRSQRYPNKFLVDSDACRVFKRDTPNRNNKASPRDVSLSRNSSEICENKQSTQSSPKVLSSQHLQLNSKTSRGLQTKHMLLPGSSRALPIPKGFQSL